MTSSIEGKTASTLEWCASSVQAGQYLFVLFDPPTDTAPAFQPSRVQPQVNLFSSRTGDPLALQIAPRLIEVPDDEAILKRLDRALARQSAEQPEMLLIAGDLQLAALTERLLKRFDVSAAGEEMLLRVWDARIFLALTTALEQPNRTNFFAFGTRALVPDRHGGYIDVALTCPSQDPLQSRRLTLGQPELDALLERSSPDALLGIVRDISPDLIQQVPDGERYGFVRRQLLECERRHLNSPRDQALALTLAIQHGTEWWRMPEWSDLLQQASQSSLLDAYLQRAQHGA